MINKLLLFLVLILNSTILFSQKSKNESSKIDSVFVYKKISTGGTTSNLMTKHSELERINAQKILLNDSDLKSFNNTLNSMKSKKLWQQKYGGEIIYLITYENGIKKNYVIGQNSEFTIIDNLSNMKRWLIKKPNDVII